MPTMITGATGSKNILANQKVIDMADKIFLLQPDVAPLYVLVSKLNKRVAINTKVEWMEDDLNPSWTTFSASATSAATALAVATGEGVYLNKWDLVKVPSTGEIMLCTESAANGFTAVRGYGTTAAASAANGAYLVILGPAFEEGSAGTQLVTKSTQTSAQFNYLQVFRKSIEITNTMANVETYGGNDRNYQRKKKGVELMRDMERAFIYGERYEDTTAANIPAGHARRTTAGIDYYIGTNSTDVGGILTESDFEAWLRSIFRYGSTEKYLFASPLIISVISQWAQGKLQTFSTDKTYGIAITQYLSPHGTVYLIKNVLLEHGGTGATALTYWGGWAFAVELEELSYRFLQNRDVVLETDIQNPSDDLVKDNYICEVGLEFHNEKKMGQLTGVTG